MGSNEKFDALLGTVIDERYKLISVVGVGGMSVVFKASDLQDNNKIVALKLLSDSSDANSHAVKCFINESRAISMLDHENIIKVYDMSLSGELKYIVMELAEGMTLKEYMQERHSKLTIEESISFIEQILLALEHAHERGVIHRDVKPHNMIVSKDGKLKVTDFGIARAPGSDTISMSDKALGTVYYISPEQASGKETGTYSDIYSVGVMLYEMTTGVLPFDADAPVSVAMKQISDDPTPPTTIDPKFPVGVEQVILKAMSKSPEDRFKSARSMLRAIRILKESPSVVFETKAKKPEESKGQDMGNQSKSKKKQTKKAKITLFPIILGMVLAFFSVLIISGMVVVLSVFNSTSASEENELYVTVPSLVGQVYDEAMAERLKEEHFEIDVRYAKTLNDTYGYGEIYSTNPSAGEVKKIKNSTGTTSLILYVNPLEGKAVFGDYTIMTLTAAKTALKNRGFDVDKIEVVRAPHDTVMEGHVFKTSPEEGEMASTADSVTLYVSTGRSLENVMAMPNLVGKSRGQATVELKDFNLEFVTVSNSADVGTVVGQSITPYTVICPEFCDTIKLFVSDGAGKTGIDEVKLYIVMPSLIGKSILDAEEAMAEFIANGIKVTYKESEIEAEVGEITEQSIPADEKVPLNYDGEIVIRFGTGYSQVEEPPVPSLPELPSIIKPDND